MDIFISFSLYIRYSGASPYGQCTKSKCKCKFKIKHRECLGDHPSQRLIIKCLTIIQIDLEFGNGHLAIQPITGALNQKLIMYCIGLPLTFYNIKSRGKLSALLKAIRVVFKFFGICLFIFSCPLTPRE